jgi:hypothetical protein
MKINPLPNAGRQLCNGWWILIFFLLFASLIPAIVFGGVTVLVPFFSMQAAFGLGVATVKSSNPAQARLGTLINRVAFGMGLYLSGL